MGVGDKIMAQPAGYSGTLLAKKLGIKAGFNIRLINEPGYYFNLFTDLPEGLYITDNEEIKYDMIHFFTKQADEYKLLLPQLKTQIKPNGMIWVSWPKKLSKVVTDITEDIIRTHAIATGLVDIKICAVDEVWSGLKMVVPVGSRQ